MNGWCYKNVYDNLYDDTVCDLTVNVASKIFLKLQNMYIFIVFYITLKVIKVMYTPVYRKLCPKHV